MRALVYEGPYQVRVRDKPDPRVEHPDDVILRVTRAGICGSDLHLFHGLVPDTASARPSGTSSPASSRRSGPR